MFGNKPGNRISIESKDGIDYPKLNKQEIDVFINQFSSSIKYWRAITCPCYTPETGQPNIACHKCRGLGYYHMDQEQLETYLKAQVHSRTSKKNDEKGGFFTTGYSSITFMPGVIPGNGDLVQVCKDREVVNDEYHVYGSTLTDRSSAETLRFRDVICVEDVVVFDQLRKNVIRLDKAKWSFNKELHRIQFVDKYDVGMKYSLRYVAVPDHNILPSIWFRATV